MARGSAGKITALPVGANRTGRADNAQARINDTRGASFRSPESGRADLRGSQAVGAEEGKVDETLSNRLPDRQAGNGSDGLRGGADGNKEINENSTQSNPGPGDYRLGVRAEHLRQPVAGMEQLNDGSTLQHHQNSTLPDHRLSVRDLAVVDAEAGVRGNAPFANVGKDASANVEMLPASSPFVAAANVGSQRQVPTLESSRKDKKENGLSAWRKATGKPPFPKGYYWQASGSRKEKGRARLFGWTLIKNDNCHHCGKRYRPPMTYLKGLAWASLQKESYERQKSEIRLLLGKSKRRLDDLRCPECLPGDDGQVFDVGKTG